MEVSVFMSDKRTYLNKGEKIRLGGIDYVIEGVSGVGGNAVVYKAKYEDSLCAGYFHSVMLKELFPYNKSGGIFRDGESIRALPECEEELQIARDSFLRGNKIHLEMLALDPELPGGNINSYEERGTLYSALEYSGRITLSDLKSRGMLPDLRDSVVIMLKLLAALRLFHENKYLHLDISPENILVNGAENKKTEERGLLLIDYNSSWDMNADSTPKFISIREGYTAPEILLDSIKDVCEATDLYSVGAVFLFLTGMTGVELYSLRVSDALSRIEGERESVKYMVMRILSRSKSVLPRMRYRSIDEMKADFEELLDRIDGRGLTHAAIWELARGKSGKHRPPDTLAKFGDEVPPYDADVWRRDTLVLGEGGSGKSTILYGLLNEKTRGYDPRVPAPVFIPLRMCDGGRDFIKRFTVREITDRKNSSPAEIAECLFGLLNKGKLHLTYILDGLDDVSVDTLPLMSEINELRQTGAVNVILSSRQESFQCDSGYNRIRLHPLTDESVSEYLAAYKLSPPSSSGSVLTNPLMLRMYSEGAANGSGAIELDEDAIIKAYLAALVDRIYKLQGDKLGVTADYAVSILLPKIAATGGVETAFRVLNRIAESDFTGIRSKTFARAFPKFAGKSRVMAEGISSGSEWMDYIVNEVLCRLLKLLEHDDPDYSFAHRRLYEYFKKQYPPIARRRRRENLFSVLPKVVITLTALTVLGFAAAWIISKTIAPADRVFPATAEEKNLCSRAMNSIVMSITSMDALIDTGESAMNELIAALDGDPVGYEQEISERLDFLSERTAAQENNVGLGAEYFSETPLPCDVLQNIFDYPKEYRDWQADKLAGFSDAYDEGVFSVNELKSAAENLISYAECSARLFNLYIKAAVAPVTVDAKKVILDSYSLTLCLQKSYLDTPVYSEENFDIIVKSLKDEMKGYDKEIRKYIK